MGGTQKAGCDKVETVSSVLYVRRYVCFFEVRWAFAARPSFRTSSLTSADSCDSPNRSQRRQRPTKFERPGGQLL